MYLNGMDTYLFATTKHLKLWKSNMYKEKLWNDFLPINSHIFTSTHGKDCIRLRV